MTSFTRTLLRATCGTWLAVGGYVTTIGARVPAAPEVKEFTMVAERFKFTPDRIEVQQGDQVRITIRSADSSHGFEIKKLKVDEFIPKGGKPVTVQFVAAVPGEFPIDCSEYCGRGHEGMRAVLVVKAK